MAEKRVQNLSLVRQPQETDPEQNRPLNGPGHYALPIQSSDGGTGSFCQNPVRAGLLSRIGLSPKLCLLLGSDGLVLIPPKIHFLSPEVPE